jgi:hypothetical protein
MFIGFYTVNLYICVFIYCSTYYCQYDTLKDPWNVCTYVCMYVRCTYVYARMCACTRACVRARARVCVFKFFNTVSWTMDKCSFTCHETVNGNCLEVSVVQALHLMYQTQDKQIISDYPKTCGSHTCDIMQFWIRIFQETGILLSILNTFCNCNALIIFTHNWIECHPHHPSKSIRCTYWELKYQTENNDYRQKGMSSYRNGDQWTEQ